MDTLRKRGASAALKIALLLLLLAVVFILSVLAGRFPLPGIQSPQTILASEMHRSILIHLRLPRVLISLILGISLSTAGLILQTIFNNPMVEPGFLGVSQGASFGAGLAIVFLNGRNEEIQLFAVFFGMCGLGLSILLANRFKFGSWVMRVVLAGIAVSALFSAGLGILKYFADRYERLPLLSFWLLGSTGRVTWTTLLPILPVFGFVLTIIFLLRWRLNLLSLDDETALSISVNVKAERLLFMFCSVVITAICISLCGIIGWIGMIVPHIARKLFGANTAYTIPASLLIGGILMIVCDDLARVMFPVEIPLGVVTSFVGAGLFLPVMSSRRVKK